MLPHLRPSIQKSDSFAQGDPTSPGEETDHANQTEQTQEELGEELFGSILELMANRRSQSPGQGRPGRAGASGSGTGPPVTTAGLVSALNEIQPARRAGFIPDVNSGAAVIPNIEVDQKFLTRIKHTLTEERHKLFNQIGEDRLDAADEEDATRFAPLRKR